MSSNTKTPTDKHTLSVIGVRDYKNALYTDYDHIAKCLLDHITALGKVYSDIKVVTGGGAGVEKLVLRWCETHDIPVETIPPNIQAYGKYRAFMIRNNHVVVDGDELVAFWDGCIELTTQAFITAVYQNRKTTIYPLI
jgi:hypothetical protein